MKDQEITHAGAFNFKERATLLDHAKWRPQGKLQLIAPLPPQALAVSAIHVMQYVAQHESIMGGRPILFGDLITVGRVTFVQFRIKPLTFAMSLNAMDGNVENLKKAFQIIVQTGCVVAIMEDNKAPADGPTLRVNFKD